MASPTGFEPCTAVKEAILAALQQLRGRRWYCKNLERTHRKAYCYMIVTSTF